MTLALLTVAGISFAVMQTLVVPALPFFQREFNTTASWVTWIATGFLLSSSVLTPILGKLGDSYGKKRMLVISLGIFGLASLAAAAAWSLASLVFFRVIQGAGAAVFPLSFGIIRDEFPPEKIGLGIGTISSVFGVGGGIGLVMSGVIIEHLTWHWLFLIGAIPVLASTVLLALFVPESPVKFPAKPDYLGGLALSLALGTLLVAISEGSNWGWASAGVLGLLTASAALFATWVAIEKRVPEPLVDLATFARREMAATNLTTLVMGFSMFSTFILLPNFVQIPLGLPPDVAAQIDYGFGAVAVEVGLFFLPSSVAMMFAGPLAGVARQPLRERAAAARRHRLPRAVARAAGDRPRRAVDDLRLDGLHGHRPRVLLRLARGAGDRVLAARRDRRGERDEHDHAHDRRGARSAGGGRDHLRDTRSPGPTSRPRAASPRPSRSAPSARWSRSCRRSCSLAARASPNRYRRQREPPPARPDRQCRSAPLCLGAMMFGAWGNPDHDESIRIIHRALDAGINFIDTADVYARGESEEIVGKALAGGRRDDVVLATKVHGTMGDDPNQYGNSRRWITRAVEDSLRRLGTDWIDLYQIHRPEPDTDIDETLGALTDLVRAGKIRAIGCSTFPAARDRRGAVDRRAPRARALRLRAAALLAARARRRGRRAARLPALRDGRDPVEPARAAAGSPAATARARGAPRAARGAACPQRFDLSLPGNQRKLEAADALAELAEEAGLTLIQLALAFVLDHPAVTARDHRPAHDGAAREPARRGRRRSSSAERARPDRRDRPAGDEPQPGRRRLAEPGARARGAAAPVVPKRSAGILLHRVRDGEREVLLVHPGGPFWAKRDDGAWSIPKGEYAEGEDPRACALREFEEELGTPLPPGTELAELGTVQQAPARSSPRSAPPATSTRTRSAATRSRSSGRRGRAGCRSSRRSTAPAGSAIEQAREKLNPAQVALLDRLE